MRARAFRLACAMLLVATTAWAHHSGAGVDRTKTVTITGVVKEFRWTNPHSWIDLEVTDAKGAPTVWSVEMNPPPYLVRSGWKASTLKPGDKVSVTLNPIRTGEPGGIFVSVTLADGRVLDGRGAAASGRASRAAESNAEPWGEPCEARHADLTRSSRHDRSVLDQRRLRFVFRLRAARRRGAAAAREVDAERLDLVVHHARADRQQLRRVLLHPVRHLQRFDQRQPLDFLERDAGRRNLHDRRAVARRRRASPVSPSRRSSTAMCVPSASSIARSIAFSSSRMLPGQW